ncbi:response regulator transcription factor [Parafilimonas sp.]|uniref:response regulator transcription factor n=1 Tax=Parafilimonas sp. TaxID=1969739 RepID=UPI003F823A82
MQPKITSYTFSSISALKSEKTERDYLSLEPYIKTAEAFARLNYQSVYIFDYYKNNFLYLSDNPLFLNGNKAALLKYEGFHYFIKHVPEYDLNRLINIHAAGFNFFHNLSPNEKLNHFISYNFHLEHTNKKVLVNQKMTPMLLDNCGSIWLALGVISIAADENYELVEIRNSDSTKRYIYKGEKNSWVSEKIVRITNREKEIALLSAQGLTNKAISTKLYLAESTIKFHKSKLFKKLGVSNITEAIGYMVTHKKI